MPDTSAGHLSVRIEGLHADDVPFLFERQPGRVGLSFVVSATFEFLVVILLIIAGRYASAPGAGPVHDWPDSRIVWLVEQGVGGGGGGGGNRMPEPPRQVQLPGERTLTVPAENPPTVDPVKQSQAEPPPVAQLTIPAQALAAAEDTNPGILDPAAPSSSQGPGTDDGAGTGAGGGVGPDLGSGLGPGSVAGTGGKSYQPGDGVTPPVEIYVPKPQYHRRCDARPRSRHGVGRMRRSDERDLHEHTRGAFTRSDIRPRSRGREGSAVVSIPSRNADGRTSSRARYDRADFLAALRGCPLATCRRSWWPAGASACLD